MKTLALCLLLSFATIFAVGAAKDGGNGTASSPPKKDLVRTVAEEKELVRVEGEQRFRTNCGRCHQVPHKFPARMMGTIVRHMRVRAMLTEEDMKLILAYMTE